jgi:hypothetical protein
MLTGESRGDDRADANVASGGDVIDAECDGAMEADFESEFFFLRREPPDDEPRRSDLPSPSAAAASSCDFSLSVAAAAPVVGVDVSLAPLVEPLTFFDDAGRGSSPEACAFGDSGVLATPVVVLVLVLVVVAMDRDCNDGFETIGIADICIAIDAVLSLSDDDDDDDDASMSTFSRSVIEPAAALVDCSPLCFRDDDDAIIYTP